MSQRILALLCAVLMVASFTACGQAHVSSESSPEVSQAVSQPPESKPTPTPVPPVSSAKPQETPSAAPEPSEEEPESTPQSTAESSSQLPEADIEEEGFTDAFDANSIDQAFFNDSEDAATSIQMVNLYNKYITIWDNQVGSLYRALLNSVSGDMKSTLKSGQEDWISGTPAALEEIRAGASGAGSNASITIAAETMNYYRTRAMELASIHYQIYGDIGFD